MSRAWLSLGSNVDAERNISGGIAALRDMFGEVALSPVYRTAAVGFDGNDFLNLAARIDTEMTPLELKAWLNDLERRYGRRRDVPRFSDRTLDIDILMYDDLWLVSPLLELPRAEILQHAHVLRPLADLEPLLQHPADGRTIAELWEDFSGDRGGMEPVDPAF